MRLFRRQGGRRRPWRRLRLGLAGLVLLYFVIVLWPYVVVAILPGQVGVLWSRFFGGTITGSHFGEGTHVKFPWDRVYFYDIRINRLDQTVHALTQDGLDVELDLSLTYGANPDTIGALNQIGGSAYDQTLLMPLLISDTVLAVSSRPTDALYGAGLEDLRGAIFARLREGIAALTPDRPPGGSLVHMVGLNITRITLPAMLRTAMEEKEQAAQDVLRYQFIVQRERLESQRKAIEAEGIKQFQATVSASLSDSYLRWKGIEATLELARSPNSKTVVIGNGPGGMPLILGGIGETAPPAAATAPAPTAQAPATTPASH
jgi:prohibitin 2